MADTGPLATIYILDGGEEWIDRGTGCVSTGYVSRLRSMSLLVKTKDEGICLLEARICVDLVYEKQQEKLIVWSDEEDYHLALSFQEKAGCDEVWEKLCQLQGCDPDLDTTADTYYEMNKDTMRPPPTFHFPAGAESPSSEYDEFDDLKTPDFNSPIR